MTQPSPTDAAAPTALSAFLRGIERRGVVFADLYLGEAAVADKAYAVGLHAFREQSLQHPFQQWPKLFWGALLAAPGLRKGAAAPRRAPAFAVLDEVSGGPRAALLLRVVAGLTDSDAASVLGIAPATYRKALHLALPRQADGTPDPEAWRVLAAAVRSCVHDLPAERLAHLARLREATVQGRRPDLIGPLRPQVASVDAPVTGRLGVGPRRLLWAGVAACGIAFAATFLWPLGWLSEGGEPEVSMRPLPQARAPAARYDRATAVLTEPDFDLLAQGDLVPPLDDPAFYAWFAAERAHATRGADPDAGMREPVSPLPESQQPESTDAP